MNDGPYYPNLTTFSTQKHYTLPFQSENNFLQLYCQILHNMNNEIYKLSPNATIMNIFSICYSSYNRLGYFALAHISDAHATK